MYVLNTSCPVGILSFPENSKPSQRKKRTIEGSTDGIKVNACFSNLDFSLHRDSMLGVWGGLRSGGAKKGGICWVGVWLGLGGGWDLHMVSD